MRPIFFIVPITLLSLTPAAQAQYGGDPNSSYIDQMVRDHINQRRSEYARGSSRAHGGKRHSPQAHARRSAAPKKGRAAAKPPPMAGTLSFTQDLFSPIGDRDKRAFTLEVRLGRPGGGGPILRRARFTPSQGWESTPFSGIPVGRYVASARVIDADGNVIPTLLGTRAGEPSDPEGGDFAATQSTDPATHRTRHRVGAHGDAPFPLAMRPP